MSTTDDHNFSELQKQTALADEKAFKVLFDNFRVRLFDFIFNITKSNEVAEELVMDVFLKLWLARDKMAEIHNLDGFLFRVAYHKCVDFFRAASNDRKITDLLIEKIQIPSQSYADAPLLMQEYENKIREAIDLLPPQRKKIFNLSKEEGLTHAQIANELGISRNTVANSIGEARQFIKNYLIKNLDLLVLMTLLTYLSKNK